MVVTSLSKSQFRIVFQSDRAYLSWQEMEFNLRRMSWAYAIKIVSSHCPDSATLGSHTKTRSFRPGFLVQYNVLHAACDSLEKVPVHTPTNHFTGKILITIKPFSFSVEMFLPIV
jgi:hypothetical protein